MDQANEALTTVTSASRRWSTSSSGFGLTIGVFAAYALVVGYNYLPYFSGYPPVEGDTPAHIYLIELLRNNLRHGRLTVYDTTFFGGASIFEYCPFLYHLSIAFLSTVFDLIGMTSSVAFLIKIANVLVIAFLPLALYYFAGSLVGWCCPCNAL